MKHLLRSLFNYSLALAAVLGAGHIAADTASAQAKDTVTILHINDSHSMLAPMGPRDNQLQGSRGGIARAASIIGLSRMTDPNVLLLHNGDFMIGDLFFNKYFGIAELRLWQALGLDALNFSNHEFDLTPAILSLALDSGFVAGNVPILTSNMVIPQGQFPSIKSRLQPYLIKEYPAGKLGIFALMTPATNLLSQPAPIFIDTNIVPLVIQHVQTLKTMGCDAVVFMSGLGVSIDKQIAAAIPGIDVIVGGDDHYLIDPAIEVINPSGEKTYIVQANAFLTHVGRLQLEISAGKTKLLNYRAIELNEQVPEEPTVKGIVDGLIADIESVYGPLYSQAVGVVTSEFSEVASNLTELGNHDTHVGNFITDIYRTAFQTDVAVHAGGSTAQVLYPGPIVPADIYRMISYGFNTDNTLGYHMATFRITGAALAAGLEFGLMNIQEEDEFLSQVSGMTYAYDPSKPPMERLVEVMIGGQPLDPTRIYSVATNEFAPMILAAVGIPYTDLRVYGGDTTEFAMILQAVIQMQTLTPNQDGRIRAVQSNSVSQEAPRAVAFASPNPCTSSTTVFFDLTTGRDATITLMDMTGKIVHHTATRGAEGRNAYDIPTSELAAGRYLCMIESGTNRQTTLITVAR